MPPRISEGNNAAQVNAELETLFKNGWKLDEEQIQLEKIYHFKTYTKVADLHHIIATRSKSENHHSVMRTEYGSLTVYWTTHTPRGLSDKDIRMAKYCDEQAKSIGTVKQNEAQRCGSVVTKV